MSDDDRRTIRVDEFLPHPPETVWRALTEPSLIARWLMPPSDFRLEVGHRFTFQGFPVPAAGNGWPGVLAKVAQVLG